MMCCMGVLGVRGFLSSHYRDEKFAFLLSLGYWFPLNFDILVRGYPRFFYNSGVFTEAAGAIRPKSSRAKRAANRREPAGFKTP